MEAAISPQRPAFSTHLHRTHLSDANLTALDFATRAAVDIDKVF